jgi:hypothetical protein
MNKENVSKTMGVMRNHMTNVMNQFKTHMNNNLFWVHLGLIVVVVILIILGIMYVHSQISKKNSNLKNMESSLSNIDKTVVSINPKDAQYKHNIRDYYIMSSYNSCSDGDFDDGYVSLDALKTVIYRGARVLDFEIYSVNNKTVVAASNKSTFTEKGTYNSIPIEQVMAAVEQWSFAAATSPNYDDPLFLHFRIKSNNPKVMSDLSKVIVGSFRGRLLSAKYGKENQGENLGALPLTDFMGKVIIMCDKTVNPKFEGSSFDDIVNIASGGAFVRSMRNYNVKYTPNSQELIEYNKKNMSITMSDLAVSPRNMDAGLHFKYGCQMVCMNFQSTDSYLTFYLERFNQANSAFILKPEQLRYIPTYIKDPTPQDPKLSYAQRNIQKPYFNHKL